ncbi:Viral movement protein [Parasponia andersonii]|uniref:Viral movement protein n=1 Tax=Parasponia andersonii TaxID=3476 RepID=A0A2P5B0B1_PARAD|nr:Viral movement protein [Parasponia andersonii]
MSTKFDQCELPATNKDLYVTLQIPPEFPPQWIDQGFSHIHFGAIRLALTYHGWKGLHVCAKIALLDTRMLKYQHAYIGIIETTLNADTYIVTFYPNFCMSLKDKRLTDAFKVQLQIIGVEQDPQAMGATLHYQMVYRVQNHALDLALPTTSDALLVSVNSHHVPSYTHIPRQISTEELKKIIPDSWITSYEQLHQPQVQIQSSDPSFKTLKDGTIEITFNKKQEMPNYFTTQYMMSTVIPATAEIESFDKDGNPCYAFSSKARHCYWNVCNCQMCASGDWQEAKPQTKKTGRILKEQLEAKSEKVGLLGQPSGKFDYIVKYSCPQNIQ